MLTIGGTGEVGGQMLEFLKRDKIPVKIVYRKRARLSKFKATGVDAVLRDLSNKESLKEALKGYSTLFRSRYESRSQLPGWYLRC